MTHQAIVDPDLNILRITPLGQDDELESGESAVKLEGWTGPPQRPSKGHALKLSGGSVLWVDLRSSGDVWVDVRAKRDGILNDTDWMVLRSMERSTPLSVGWRSYRQALRDITDQPDPFNISWPTPPSS